MLVDSYQKLFSLIVAPYQRSIWHCKTTSEL